MSKLYNLYVELKKQNSNTIYLFKSGIFFIAIEDDAYCLSKLFNFKIGNLTETVAKCGFPCSSINKYSNLFKAHNLNIKIIENTTNTIYNFKEYAQDNSIIELLDFINSVDTNNLSITEAYKFIDNLKSKVFNIKKENLYEKKK